MGLKRRDIVSGGLIGAIVAASQKAGLSADAPAAGPASQPGGPVFLMRPIGRVEKADKGLALRIFDEFVPGLKGLEEFSHVNVLYWFDRNDTPEKRRTLQVHPRGDKKNPLTGVFACRSPFRPNLIALTICRIVSIEGGLVKVEGLDAFEQTPILDLKPYIPALDAAAQIKLPKWVNR